MGDLLKQGSQWLAEQRAAHVAGPVTYRRGVIETELGATFGRTSYDVQDEYGATVQAHVTDFLIRASELAPVFDRPEAGDRIVAPSTGSGQATVYEVMSLAGQGHWRWSGPYRITMRIHAKEVGAE